MKRSIPTEQELIYHIDGRDRLCAVGADWSECALANDGTDVLPERVLGRSLWDFIGDANVRELYRQMVHRARCGYPAQFDYRCDAPEWRRRYRMTIRLAEDGNVAFLSQLLRAEQRPRMDLLDVKTPRSEHWVRVCCWCQDVALPDGSWVSVEEAVRHMDLLADEAFPMLTHGICPPCQAQMLAQLAEPAELLGSQQTVPGLKDGIATAAARRVEQPTAPGTTGRLPNMPGGLPEPQSPPFQASSPFPVACHPNRVNLEDCHLSIP